MAMTKANVQKCSYWAINGAPFDLKQPLLPVRAFFERFWQRSCMDFFGRSLSHRQIC